MHRFSALCVAAVAMMATAACRHAQEPRRKLPAAEPVRVRETRMAMGTYVTMTVYAPSEEAGKEAIATAFGRVERLEATVSTWRRESDGSRLNREAGGEAVAVDARLVALLGRAVSLSRETGGAFDITVGPLVRLYKRCYRRRRLPTDEERAAAMALVGYQAIEVDAKRGTARLARERMRVDFGAVGKGYIVDAAVAALRATGIEAALVDAGGDLYALGAPPEREGWLIGVRDPARPDAIRDERLQVRDVAVATSGDYEQFIVLDGRRYSHILDPRSGRPVEHVSSVTIVAPDATRADAYATACSVLGPERAAAFVADRPGVELLLFYRRAAGQGSVRSDGFARFIAPEDASP